VNTSFFESTVGARDIGIGSLNFYSFIVPCMIKAKETDDQQKMESCLCTVHELANKLLFRKFTNTSALVAEFKRVAENVRHAIHTKIVVCPQNSPETP